MSNLNQKIAGLVLQNIEFQNDEAETLVEGVVNATADLTSAGIKFDALAGESQTAQDAVEGLVDLAAEIGVAYPELTISSKALLPTFIREKHRNLMKPVKMCSILPSTLCWPSKN